MFNTSLPFLPKQEAAMANLLYAFWVLKIGMCAVLSSSDLNVTKKVSFYLLHFVTNGGI